MKKGNFRVLCQLFAILLYFFSIIGASAQNNFYYGNIHSHSGYSDGNQDSTSSQASTPTEDFDYAKNSLHFDFLGISDHNHSIVGMTKAKYHLGVAQAVAANTSTFSALYGMEYGVSSTTGSGHVLVYGIDSLIGWETGYYDIYNSKTDYNALYTKINGRPGSLLSLAHPQSGDFANIEGTSYSSNADQAISGVSVRSGYAFSTTQNYTDVPATLYEPFFNTMLAKGYHVAPSIDHDNHNTTFGRTLPGRTVVLASSNTKANILSALKNMHYYASDDWNVQVTYAVSGQIMGNIANIAGDPIISVSVVDGNSESVSFIEIWSGVPGSNSAPTVLTSVTNSATLNYTDPIAIGQTRYYYAKIKQPDGDYIWTAPIWVTKTSAFDVELLDLVAEAQPLEVDLHWRAAAEVGLSDYLVERSFDGLKFEKIGEVKAENLTDYYFVDTQVPRGQIFYRLQMRDTDGKSRYSSIVSVYYDRNPVTNAVLFPNPVSDHLTIQFEYNQSETDLYWNIYYPNGQRIMGQKFAVNAGMNTLQVPVDDLPLGNYIFTVSNAEAQFMVEKNFVKG